MDDPAFGRLLALKTDVLEVSRVPQGVEIALESGGVVDVSGMGENARLDGFGGDAAIAVDPDLADDLLLGPAARTEQDDECQQQACDEILRSPAPSSPTPCK